MRWGRSISNRAEAGPAKGDTNGRDRRPAVGFIGLGTMGEPMALNLRWAGVPLVVWSRTADKTRSLADAGAEVARTPDELFARTQTTFLMLSTEAAVDEVLARGTPSFAEKVRHATIVQLGTTSTAFSVGLARDIEAAGGAYVEAPVSGSRSPAQAGQLVVMVAGQPHQIERIRPLLEPMCRSVLPCGPVPQALGLKLASNHYVYTLVVALAETVHFARKAGVDLDLLSSLLSVGPMASDLLRAKLPKLVADDFSPQASVATTAIGMDLFTASARRFGAATPLLDACAALCDEAMALGLGEADAAAIVRAIEARAAPR